MKSKPMLEYKKPSFSSCLKFFIDLFDFNIRVMLCNLLKKFLSFVISVLHEKKNIIWVAYYPAGVYFFSEDRYAIVSFDKNYNNPQWKHLSLEVLAEKTGYDKSKFAL